MEMINLSKFYESVMKQKVNLFNQKKGSAEFEQEITKWFDKVYDFITSDPSFGKELYDSMSKTIEKKKKLSDKERPSTIYPVFIFKQKDFRKKNSKGDYVQLDEPFKWPKELVFDLVIKRLKTKKITRKIIFPESNKSGNIFLENCIFGLDYCIVDPTFTKICSGDGSNFGIRFFIDFSGDLPSQETIIVVD